VDYRRLTSYAALAVIGTGVFFAIPIVIIALWPRGRTVDYVSRDNVNDIVVVDHSWSPLDHRDGRWLEVLPGGTNVDDLVARLRIGRIGRWRGQWIAAEALDLRLAVAVDENCRAGLQHRRIGEKAAVGVAVARDSTTGTRLAT
jgi:hypothetical protein